MYVLFCTLIFVPYYLHICIFRQWQLTLTLIVLIATLFTNFSYLEYLQSFFVVNFYAFEMHYNLMICMHALLKEKNALPVTCWVTVHAGRQNSAVVPKILILLVYPPCIISSPWAWVELVNMTSYQVCDYVTVYGKEDFTDVTKTPNLLTLNE